MPTNELGREREARSEPLTSEEIGELEREVAHIICQHMEADGPCLGCSLDDKGPRGGVRGCILAATKAAREVLSLPRLLSALKRAKEEGSAAQVPPPIASTAEASAALFDLLSVVKYMLGAIDCNTIDSEQIDGDYDSGIPPHKWHEQWAYYARAAVNEAEAILSPNDKNEATDGVPSGRVSTSDEQ